jgi:glycosyltransferase involved in cell wall biosynthesis
LRILIALTYYRPHYSGLTIYTERLARALARRGHQVTVLTSRFDPHLPQQEVRHGVNIIRPRVLMRLSKGVIMPSLPLWAWRLVRQADVVNVHVPQLDAAPISLISRVQGRPVVMTYHCDLRLPSGLIHALANRGSHIANWVSARAANLIVTNTRDYAENSSFLKPYLPKVRAIFPPVELAVPAEEDLAAFRQKYKLLPGQRIVGMAARLATEKGVEFLVEAFPPVLEKYPQARVLFVGQHTGVIGEEKYAQKLAPLIQAMNDHWSFLGILPPEELAAFYRLAEVTVLPSLNSTESFGMVQVESMISGTPVVASDLPGVRQPVLMTGMGCIVPPADAGRLAQAIISVLDHPEQYRKDAAEVARLFAPDTIAAEYEGLFEGLISK